MISLIEETRFEDGFVLQLQFDRENELEALPNATRPFNRDTFSIAYNYGIPKQGSTALCLATGKSYSLGADGAWAESGQGGTSGVSSFGGETGDITVGDGLVMEGKELKATGGGGGLPTPANAGDAMIYNGTEWTKQSGYGYEIEGSTKVFTFDGNIEGKVVVYPVDDNGETIFDWSLVKISDEVPDSSQVISGIISMVNNEEKYAGLIVEEEIIEDEDGFSSYGFSVFNKPCTWYDEEFYDVPCFYNIPEPGIYFFYRRNIIGGGREFAFRLQFGGAKKTISLNDDPTPLEERPKANLIFIGEGDVETVLYKVSGEVPNVDSLSLFEVNSSEEQSYYSYYTDAISAEGMDLISGSLGSIVFCRKPGSFSLRIPEGSLMGYIPEPGIYFSDADSLENWHIIYTDCNPGTTRKIESKYIPETLPQEAISGEAMIYNGTEWSKQKGYGFEGEKTYSLSFDGDPEGKIVAPASGLPEGCSGGMVYISEMTPSSSSFVKGGFVTLSDGGFVEPSYIDPDFFQGSSDSGCPAKIENENGFVFYFSDGGVQTYFSVGVFYRPCTFEYEIFDNISETQRTISIEVPSPGIYFGMYNDEREEGVGVVYTSNLHFGGKEKVITKDPQKGYWTPEPLAYIKSLNPLYFGKTLYKLSDETPSLESFTVFMKNAQVHSYIEEWENGSLFFNDHIILMPELDLYICTKPGLLGFNMNGRYYTAIFSEPGIYWENERIFNSLSYMDSNPTGIKTINSRYIPSATETVEFVAFPSEAKIVASKTPQEVAELMKTAPVIGVVSIPDEDVCVSLGIASRNYSMGSNFSLSRAGDIVFGNGDNSNYLYGSIEDNEWHCDELL